MSKFESEISKRGAAATAEAEQSWTSRAVDSFLESGKAALNNPVDTAVGLGTAAGIGAGIQATLNAAERVGGKVGATAEVAKVALLVLPTVYTGFKIGTASDTAKEAGRAIFDTGLFMGAAGLGASAVRASFTSSEAAVALTGTRQSSLLSETSRAVRNPLPLELQQSITLMPFQMPHMIDK